MKLLAVETATEACSAALMINGEIAEQFTLTANGHSKLILPMIDALLAEANLQPSDLDGLAFGCGPGSFTGVRIATGVIQGIAFALGLPVVPVSNLAAVAQDFFDHNDDNLVFVAMDARMNQVYWGVYQRGLLGFAELLGKEAVLAASEIVFPDVAGVGLGTGWRVYHQELSARLSHRIIRYEADNLPRARAVARLGFDGFNHGLTVIAEHAMPIYLRDKVAKKESERN
ncbi:universal protein YeaZ [Methyloglobulus morosus KoM1]|uniref:tRNA threonylcarbamoyladenosine biosynthesis protein TsaB n=1 Tax=Methyloglobulus morosus KoM1 TaxID=1116472 RepID=V5E0A2_9GAMM|nr:tRNA (adenosine(37)-N6)-threonylcarbamoyltransferase complex dimerization subunit type 1 TsaB [Methyloglobulus morosus]ESS72981.1 universal protein YeaZ [Methyloglobulus morosus KoM1]